MFIDDTEVTLIFLISWQEVFGQRNEILELVIKGDAPANQLRSEAGVQIVKISLTGHIKFH